MSLEHVNAGLEAVPEQTEKEQSVLPNAGDSVDSTAAHTSAKSDADKVSLQSLKSKTAVITVAETEGIQERLQWNNQWEFLMSCISMSVGLGNVWRFPVTAYENGGGAFLIPYLIVLILIGRPVYFLELTIGQFSSCSQINCWTVVPFFTGVGYSSLIASIVVSTYYVNIMAITLYYFGISFQTTLPWLVCDRSWSGACTSKGESATNISIPEMYYLREVVKEAPNIDNGIGTPYWKLVLCLFIAWILIFGSLVRGVQSSGKVAYFTAIFPYSVLIVLLIRGLTLDGAMDGIKFFITPDWRKLLEPRVWFAAVSQCFFSLGNGFGIGIMFCSYNPFNHNIYRDAWIISIMDTFTSLLAGFTIFAVLGSLANQLGVTVPEVVQGGAGLAFVSYPEAIAKFDWVPQLFAVLFFLMLFTLGLGIAVSFAGVVISVLCDKFPELERLHVTLGVCAIECALGVAYTTPGGPFIQELVDFYGGGFILYTTCILEVIGIAWVYGVYNYIDDIEFMLNIRLGWYWKICWGIIIPVCLTAILLFSFADDMTPHYKDVSYPVIALVFGWSVAAVALLSFPVGGIQAMTEYPGTILERFIASNKPKSAWGPRPPQKRLEWMEFKAAHPPMSFLERIRNGKL